MPYRQNERQQLLKQQQSCRKQLGRMCLLMIRAPREESARKWLAYVLFWLDECEYISKRLTRF